MRAENMHDLESRETTLGEYDPERFDLAAVNR